jgi:hypothetical protein
MHPEARAFVAGVVPRLTQPPQVVIDLGGRNINGSARDLFLRAEYTSVDCVNGRGVDLVADAVTWHPPAPVSCVLCLEVLEHTPQAGDLVQNAAAMVASGGSLILTCATTGRPSHSAVDGRALRMGEFYHPPTEDEVRLWLLPTGLVIREMTINPKTHDLYCWAVRSSTTVVTYTDNALPESLAAPVRRVLLSAAEGLPVICVSHRPVDCGQNLVIGPAPRSYLTMTRQMLLGVEAATTDTIALAEHDVLYTAEHFRWSPPDLNLFYYNRNRWFANAKAGDPGWGTYSWAGGKWPCVSLLICGREILLSNLRNRVEKLEQGWTYRRGVPGVCEPGYVEEQAFKQAPPMPSPATRPVGFFSTSVPNVDLKHGGNLTGWRRGTNCCLTLPPWGRLEEVLGHA